MAALPKKKMPSSRKGNRRSHHRASLPTLVPCPQCRLPKPAHRVCPSCGSYHGRTVLPQRSS
ncbi:MAG: 50S ribosomal protein L32 [Chloroflexi bacterium]|nr:50S ribosomal protein L32 [Chloroflexota bacterium]